MLLANILMIIMIVSILTGICFYVAYIISNRNNYLYNASFIGMDIQFLILLVYLIMTYFTKSDDGGGVPNQKLKMGENEAPLSKTGKTSPNIP